MSNYNGWAGIRNFKGTFDGNGYIISNLSGIQGLFANTTDATVKNIGLYNINVKGNLSYTGGLIGYAKTTNISNCYSTGSIISETTSKIKTIAIKDNSIYSCGTGGLIGMSYVGEGNSVIYDNISSSASVKGKDGVGGLIGASITANKNTLFIVKNGYSIGTVAGNNGIGGFYGITYSNEGTSADNSEIYNCYSGGNVLGNKDVGGFIGSYFYNRNNKTQGNKISNCESTGNVTGLTSNVGAFIGHIYLKFEFNTLNSLNQSMISFENCSYSDISNNLNPYGIVTDEKNAEKTIIESSTSKVIKEIKDILLDTGAVSGLKSINFAGSIPSIESDGSGAYMSNIIAVLEKSNIISNNFSTDKISEFLYLFSNNKADNTKLWYLNIAILDYLKNEKDKEFPIKLYKDIINNEIKETAIYQAGKELQGDIIRGAGNSWKREELSNLKKGEVIIPTINNIADEVYYLMLNNGITTEREKVRTYFNQYDISNQTDRISLANINDKITNNGDLNVLYNYIINGDYKIYDDEKWSDTEKWKISVEKTDQQIQNSKTKTDKIGEHDKYWDTNDPEISKAITKWHLLQRSFTIVSEEQASSNRWFSSIITNGHARLTAFNPNNITKLLVYSADDLALLPENEYNELLEINSKNIEKEMFLQEVSDEINIRKAEAQYETNMKIIESKDKRYNMQIAGLENEKIAIKKEIESLKIIIHDNNEITSKLSH